MQNLPKIGDHILVDRIVLEKSCFEEILSNVVSLDKRNIAKVEITSLEEFASGDTWQIKEYTNAPFSGQEVALRTKERIGEQKYNLLINNCEHFCSECIFGEHVSEQVQNAKQNSAIFSEIEPYLMQIIGELLGAQSKDDIKQVFTKSLTELAQNSKDNAEQKAREMIKENGEKINSQIEKFIGANADINDVFQNISKDIKAKIARDFNIKI